MSKSADAFRTISEVADWLGVQSHVLRFWESKFSQVKPVKRAGGRRYYRPVDMLLLGGIRKLLHDDGLTIKGVQKVLREKGIAHVSAMSHPLEGGVETAATPVTKAPLLADAPRDDAGNVVDLTTQRATAPEQKPAPAPQAAAPAAPDPEPPVRPSFTEDAVGKTDTPAPMSAPKPAAPTPTAPPPAATPTAPTQQPLFAPDPAPEEAAKADPAAPAAETPSMPAAQTEVAPQDPAPAAVVAPAPQEAAAETPPVEDPVERRPSAETTPEDATPAVDDRQSEDTASKAADEPAPMMFRRSPTSDAPSQEAEPEPEADTTPKAPVLPSFLNRTAPLVPPAEAPAEPVEATVEPPAAEPQPEASAPEPQKTVASTPLPEEAAQDQQADAPPEPEAPSEPEPAKPIILDLPEVPDESSFDAAPAVLTRVAQAKSLTDPAAARALLDQMRLLRDRMTAARKE